MEKLTAYYAPEKLVHNVVDEVGKPLGVFDRLVLAKGKPIKSVWAQNIWLETKKVKFASIGAAVKILRDVQRNWVMCPTVLHGRAKLIQEQLPHVSAKPLEFPSKMPSAPLGSWALIAKDELIYSAKCSSAFANGEMNFVEDKEGPPNRAYLKLWEAFTRIERMPKKGERCLDAGASPGGWTWVVSTLDANVVAIDRSPLEKDLMKHPRVDFTHGDAFAMRPGHKRFDWLLSDVACYPEKLFDWIEPWVKSGLVKNFVCTLKFQGKSHYGAIKKFEKIPGSEIFHLFHNKHELTWVKVSDKK